MSASEMNTAEWQRDIATPEGSRVAIAMTRAVREALGMFAGAMPITPREAFEQALEEARRLSGSRTAESAVSGRNAAESVSYDNGYRDGESSYQADWDLALDDLLPDDVEALPTQVAEYIRQLKEGR